jgi:hypothetical protein
MHPGAQEEQDEMLSLDDQEGQAANCPTPHEARSLNWPSDQVQDGEEEEEEAPTRPATPTQHLEDHDDRALLALPPPPPLPSLPPIETAPLRGPLTRSFSHFLHDDSKFFRPVAVPAAAPVPLRRIQPTPLLGNAASAAALSAGSRVKRARATPASSKSLATASAPAPAPASAPAAAAAPPPRKKRRGMRPGTYMCLFKGELYECPHGCDIVEKGLLYDLLRR